MRTFCYALNHDEFVIGGAPESVVEVGDGVGVVHERLQFLRADDIGALRDEAMADFFAVLKPGGYLAVEDHRADPKPENSAGADGYLLKDFEQAVYAA